MEQALRTQNGFNPGEARDKEGKWAAKETASLKDFFFKLKSDPNAHLQSPVGELTARASARVSKALGNSVDEVWIHSDEYRHIQRLHPEIGEADLHALPETIRTADVIRKSTTDSGEPAVEIWKKDKAWKFVVGTGRRGTARLYVKTFKHKGEKPI